MRSTAGKQLAVRPVLDTEAMADSSQQKRQDYHEKLPFVFCL